MALVIAGVTLLGVAIYTNCMNNESVKKVSMRSAKKGENFQIDEDADIGIRYMQNFNSSNAIISEEVPGIIRARDYDFIGSVRENALDFSNKVREKNKALGELNFTPDNRDIILVPSYFQKVLPMTVPNPSVIPWYKKVPNAWLDRDSSEITADNQPWLYRDPYGELISPYNLPSDIIQEDVKFGNPWGPSGLYNVNIREGGQRLEKTHDYNPSSYKKKQVSFKVPPL